MGCTDDSFEEFEHTVDGNISPVGRWFILFYRASSIPSGAGFPPARSSGSDESLRGAILSFLSPQGVPLWFSDRDCSGFPKQQPRFSGMEAGRKLIEELFGGV